MLTADTITDEQIRDLARFAVAECFRALGKPNADKVDAALAKLVGSSTRAVSADAIRLYCDSGMLTRPAAGQLTLTAKGRLVNGGSWRTT